MDNTNCKLIAWRHFNDMIGREPEYDKIGINKVDFIGQTGIERTADQRQREPGDYEAQVGQGPITIHADERLGQTDTGVAMLRALLRRQIRQVSEGNAPKLPPLNDEGNVSTYSGDFVVRVKKDADDPEGQQRRFGRALAKILTDTLPLGFARRQAEVKQRIQEFPG